MLCPTTASWPLPAVPSSSDLKSEISISSLLIFYPILSTHHSLEQTIITQIVMLLNRLDALGASLLPYDFSPVTTHCTDAVL